MRKLSLLLIASLITSSPSYSSPTADLEIPFKKTVTEIFRALPKDAPKKDLIVKLIQSKGSLLPFLTRSFENVRLSDKGDLEICEEEYKIYCYLTEKGYFVPYRMPKAIWGGGYLKEIPFTSTAIMPYVYHRFEGLLNDPNCGFISVQPEKSHPRLDLDIYRIRSALAQFEGSTAVNDTGFTIPKTPLVLGVNNTNGHTTLVVSVLDHSSKKVHLSLVLDSADDESYFNRLSSRFCMDDALRGSAVPFVSCLYKLQTDEKDKNCLIYAYHFADAFLKLMRDETLRTQFLRFAEGYVTKKDESALQALKKILLEELKSYLPQYYKDGKPLTSSQIEDYHRRLRWQLGCEWFTSLYARETDPE